MSESQFSKYFTEKHIVKEKDEPKAEKYLKFFSEFYLGLEFGFIESAMVLVGKDNINGQIVILDGEIFSNTYPEKFMTLVIDRLADLSEKKGGGKVFSYSGINCYIHTKEDYLPDILSITARMKEKYREFKDISINPPIDFIKCINLIAKALDYNLSSSTIIPLYKLVVHENAKPIIEGFQGGFKFDSYLFKAMLYALYPLLECEIGFP